MHMSHGERVDKFIISLNWSTLNMRLPSSGNKSQNEKNLNLHIGNCDVGV
jgi:hypothetical protein